jgi:hypothetical protein
MDLPRAAQASGPGLTVAKCSECGREARVKVAQPPPHPPTHFCLVCAGLTDLARRDENGGDEPPEGTPQAQMRGVQGVGHRRDR